MMSTWHSRSWPAFPLVCLALSAQAGQTSPLADLLRQSKWGDLERAATLVIESGKGDVVQALEYRAQARMSLGDLPGAETDLLKSVALSPEDITGWFNLGVLRAAGGGSRQKVLDSLDHLVDLDPERALQFIRLPDVSRILVPSDPVELGDKAFDREKSPKPKRVPPYPADAKIQWVQGDVGVELILDQDGRPVQVKAISGPRMLRNAAEYCGIQLRYPIQPDAGIHKPVRLVQAIPFKLR